MLIHPSLIEKVSLDSREHNADVAADIKRSFAYVGPITVGVHKPSGPDAPVSNEMRLICRMSRPYWTSEGDGDEMWDAMRTWLEAKAYKVASTIANFNTSRSEAGRQTVAYDRVELDMKPYSLGIACVQGDGLPDVVAVAARVRELLAQGALPADMAGVEVPAAASLAEQVERTREQAEAAAAAATAGEGEEAQVEDIATVASMGEGQSTEPAPSAQVETAPDGTVPSEEQQPAEPACEAADEAAPEAPARLKHASDDLVSLDYTLWDVCLADGSVRTLDSVAGTWA